jgi:hypothetical protein
VRPTELRLDTLLASPGPAWATSHSKHFAVYVERSQHLTTAAEMLDSLEAAWQHAVTLLEVPVPDGPRVPVLVTASRTRFSRLLGPQGKV